MEDIFSRGKFLVLSVTPFEIFELSFRFTDLSVTDSISDVSSAEVIGTCFFGRVSSLPGDLFLELDNVVFPDCRCLVGLTAGKCKSSLTIGWGRLNFLGEMGDFEAAFLLASFRGDLLIECSGE